jgi:FKBP-type peptidyl-prolyl cis-trans isomerase
MEVQNEKIFNLCKRYIDSLRSTFQRQKSSEDQLDDNDDLKISEALYEKGEERKKERATSKATLISAVEADAKARTKLEEAITKTTQHLEESGKRMNQLVDVLQEFLQLKRRKLEMELNNNGN